MHQPSIQRFRAAGADGRSPEHRLRCRDPLRPMRQSELLRFDPVSGKNRKGGGSCGHTIPRRPFDFLVPAAGRHSDLRAHGRTTASKSPCREDSTGYNFQFKESAMDDGKAFVDDLQRHVKTQLASLDLLKDDGSGKADPAEVVRRLKIALKNELEAAELAATWIPTTPEVDVRLALAR